VRYPGPAETNNGNQTNKTFEESGSGQEPTKADPQTDPNNLQAEPDANMGTPTEPTAAPNSAPSGPALTSPQDRTAARRQHSQPRYRFTTAPAAPVAPRAPALDAGGWLPADE
jgi:hypothetical protein